jgi:hypothetical protein
METFAFYLENRDYLNCKNYLKSIDENSVCTELVSVSQDFGIFPMTILMDVANEIDTAFWYLEVSFQLYFIFNYIDGAMDSGLFYMTKAHLKDETDIWTLEAILAFGGPPEVVLTKSEGIKYANKLLALDSKNERAIEYLEKL